MKIIFFLLIGLIFFHSRRASAELVVGGVNTVDNQPQTTENIANTTLNKTPSISGENNDSTPTFCESNVNFGSPDPERNSNEPKPNADDPKILACKADLVKKRFECLKNAAQDHKAIAECHWAYTQNALKECEKQPAEFANTCNRLTQNVIEKTEYIEKYCVDPDKDVYYPAPKKIDEDTKPGNVINPNRGRERELLIKLLKDTGTKNYPAIPDIGDLTDKELADRLFCRTLTGTRSQLYITWEIKCRKTYDEQQKGPISAPPCRLKKRKGDYYDPDIKDVPLIGS